MEHWSEISDKIPTEHWSEISDTNSNHSHYTNIGVVTMLQWRICQKFLIQTTADHWSEISDINSREALVRNF